MYNDRYSRRSSSTIIYSSGRICCTIINITRRRISRTFYLVEIEELLLYISVKEVVVLLYTVAKVVVLLLMVAKGAVVVYIYIVAVEIIQ